ncbi:MAG: hypothetical protein KGL10_05995 [Alphaproteobacteria bacterium]|nr:hypothetical protein [Alphaproteobacteria bacterium]MDE2336845.1 hypothetical protein [Alphaproteobacteria bacterium]
MPTAVNVRARNANRFFEGFSTAISQSVPANANAGADREEIVISPPVLSAGNGRARLAAEIRVGADVKTLWFEVEEDYKDYLAADTLDAFVVASLVPAILQGRNMRLEWPMSARLFYNLSRSLIPILAGYFERPPLTRVIPHGFTPAASGGAGVAAGFSGGIDSFCNYYDHAQGRVPDAFSLTHFIFNNVGAHGQMTPNADRALFLRRYTRLRECAKKLGKPVIAVDSSLDEFLGKKFELTHTLRNVAVALLMQKRIGKFLYASGYPLSETKLGPDSNMSHLEPVILPLLGTERIECMGSGGQHSRVEKTRRVAEVEESRHYLDVCVSPHNAPDGIANCGVCWKCIRTATTLKILGRLEEYGKVFDLRSFATFDNLYLVEAIGGKSIYAKEIRRLIAEEGYRVPLAVRCIAALLPAAAAQQFSMRIIPALLRHRALARFINGCLAW